MKTRMGFVSNSSSSSFVIIGYRISEDELVKILKAEGEDEDDVRDDVYTKLNDLGLDYANDESDRGMPVGKMIAEGDDVEDTEMSLSELVESVGHIKKILKQDGDPIIIAGTQMT